MAYIGLENCWPVPPESGWAFARSARKNLHKGITAFQQKWDGNFNIKGEREIPEMQICFGSNFEAQDFLNSNAYKHACSGLYELLLQSLVE